MINAEGGKTCYNLNDDLYQLDPFAEPNQSIFTCSESVTDSDLQAKLTFICSSHSSGLDINLLIAACVAVFGLLFCLISVIMVVQVRMKQAEAEINNIHIFDNVQMAGNQIRPVS
jgi:hypothetical protein